MSFLKKIFNRDKSEVQENKIVNRRQKNSLKIKQIDRLTPEAVKITFEVPLLLTEEYYHSPGQYVNIGVEINGKVEHRSYSICSDISEPLAIGIKKVKNGVVSSHFNDFAKVGQKIEVSVPTGNFTLANSKGYFVGIAAGSGITPLLSIAKMINRTDGAKMDLIFGNRDDKSIMFEQELNDLSPEKINVTHVFSEQEKEDFLFGMLTEETLEKILTNKPELLQADGFYICGPEPVLLNAKNVLQKQNISSDKIFFELFNTPVAIESKTKASSTFSVVSQVTVILDNEEEQFILSSDGDTILEEAESHGIDAPYSCRGVVCSTCKAKVLKGDVVMDKNFTLSDKEIEEGYILTCQAHPNSPEITVSYDDV